MDRKKKRKLRRSGTVEGAKQVQSMIIRAMGRAIKEHIPLEGEVPRYLATIPAKEFETLMMHLEAVSLGKALSEAVLREARRRAEEDLLS